MSCSHCHQQLDEKSGFVLCHHCGTVNISPSTSIPAKPSYLSLLNNLPVKRKLVEIGASAVVALALLGGGIFVYQDHAANVSLRIAEATSQQGDYSVARQQLILAEKYLSTASTKKRIQSTQHRNNRWLADQGKLRQAKALTTQGKLSEAKALISQINKDFPDYAQVAKLLASIQSKELAVQKVIPPTVPTIKPSPIVAKSAPAASGTSCYQVGGSPQRSTVDLGDDVAGYQVHIVYALPSDLPDNQYDINGSIARSVSAWNNWLCNQTGGKKLRLDTHGGALDVSFVRFNASDETIKRGTDLPYGTDPNNNPYVREDIEIHLKQLGFNDPHKLYAVYYDGTSNHSCGGGAWPPEVVGHVGVEYLHGGQANYPIACESNHLTTDMNVPGYFEFDILHEVMHTLGFVARCAPHNIASAHVSDGNNDLMYSGSQPWYASVLDINHDDYFSTGNPNCLDLINSTFLIGGGSQLPPQW